jgi:hypothetical protein
MIPVGFQTRPTSLMGVWIPECRGPPRSFRLKVGYEKGSVFRAPAPPDENGLASSRLATVCIWPAVLP